jgi:hypothetical protein
VAVRCTAVQACSYFPGAATALEIDLEQGCSPRPPSLIVEQISSSMVVRPGLARVPIWIGTGTQVVGTPARLSLDEDHQRLGQNPIVLHGLGGGP